MSDTAHATAWVHGRFDAQSGPSKLLFGRMYEDAAIECAAFAPGGRVFCIASAGCTAMQLAPCHEVVAVDINPAQLAYAGRRFAGERGGRGTAERIMAFGRAFAPAAGWHAATLRTFLDLDDTVEQMAYWRRYLDTGRFRMAVDTLLSIASLRTVYASPFLAFLPPRMGAVMRGRMERCFARHPNRTNPYARALLQGEWPDEAPPAEASRIRLVLADAAEFLEAEPAGSFAGFALSNVLDGASTEYGARLIAAVKRAATKDAVTVLRSFRDEPQPGPTNRAGDDRAMLWGIVDVRPASQW